MRIRVTTRADLLEERKTTAHRARLQNSKAMRAADSYERSLFIHRRERDTRVRRNWGPLLAQALNGMAR